MTAEMAPGAFDYGEGMSEQGGPATFSGPSVPVPARVWTRAEIVAEAREWVGTPYMHGQRLKGKAADCIGFAGGVGLVLGMPSAIAWSRDPEMRGYGTSPDVGTLMRGLSRYLVPIPMDEAGLGDLLLLRWPSSGHSESSLPHFGVIVDEGPPRRIVHSYASVAKTVETPITGEWRNGITWARLVRGAYRYKELA